MTTDPTPPPTTDAEPTPPPEPNVIHVGHVCVEAPLPLPPARPGPERLAPRHHARLARIPRKARP